MPSYAVEFKTPRMLAVLKLVADLPAIEPLRFVIDREGDTFEFHATHLITAEVTRIFWYILDRFFFCFFLFPGGPPPPSNITSVCQIKPFRRMINIACTGYMWARCL